MTRCAVKNPCSRLSGRLLHKRTHEGPPCRGCHQRRCPLAEATSPAASSTPTACRGQARSREVHRALTRHQMVGSMSGVGSAGDNAAMESSWLLQKNGWPRRVQGGGRRSSRRRAGPNGLFRIGSVLPTIALCVSARWNRTLRTAVQVPQLADLADEHGGWLERQCSGPVALPSWPSPPTSLLPRSGRTQRVFGLSPVRDQHRPGKDRQPQNGQSQQTPAPGCHQVTCLFLPRPSLESYFC